jgi:hypothetical protein
MDYSVIGDEVQAVSKPNRIFPYGLCRRICPEYLVRHEVEAGNSSLIDNSVSDPEDDGVVVEDIENVNSRLGQSGIPDRFRGDCR